MTGPDVIVSDEGSIWLFYPRSEAAQAWWAEHVDPDALTYGRNFVVEHRFARDIVDGLAAEGFTIN